MADQLFQFQSVYAKALSLANKSGAENGHNYVSSR